MDNTVLEFFPSANAFNKKYLKRRIIVTPRVPLLIIFLVFSLLPYQLQFNHIISAVQLILITTIIISHKGC